MTSGALFSRSPRLVPAAIANNWPDKRPELLEHFAALEKQFFRLDVLLNSFVEPSLQNINPSDFTPTETGPVSRSPALELLNAWLADSPKAHSHTAVLSDAGMGKTSLLIILRVAYLLGMIRSGIRIELLTCDSSTVDKVGTLIDPGRTLLLLDALDEDASARLNPHERIQELMHASRNCYHCLLACRTEWFPSDAEQSIGVPGLMAVHGFPTGRLFIAPFDDSQLVAYVRNRFHGKTLRFQEQALEVAQSNDVFRRPMVLSWLDELIQFEPRVTCQIDVYERVLGLWLSREKRKRVITSIDEAWAACSLLAEEMFKTGQMSVSHGVIQQYFGAALAPSIEERSLLCRDSIGQFRFAHPAFLYYLVARALARQPTSLETTSQVRSFLQEYIRFRGLVKPRGLDLRLTRWNGDDLKGIDFTNADLTGARFENVRMEGCVLVGARLQDVHFVLGQWEDCDFQLCDLSRGVAENVVFRRCTFTKGIAPKENGGVVFQDCRWTSEKPTK